MFSFKLPFPPVKILNLNKKFTIYVYKEKSVIMKGL